MENPIINHLAVLACAIFSMLLGALWYSPALFYKAWKSENNLTDEELKAGNPLKIYGVSFILAYIMSYNMAFFLGGEETTLEWGIMAGFLTGFGWAAAIFAVIALFELKTWRYILINCGYIIIFFTGIGTILGAWK